MSLQQCKLGNGQAPYTEAAAKASAVRSHWRGQGASRCFSKRWELVPNVSLNETTRPKYPWNTRGSKSVVVQPVGSPVLMKGMTPSPWAAKTTRGQRDGAFKDGTGTGRTVAGLDLWSEVRCIKMCCHYFWSLWSNLFLFGNSESLGGWGPGTLKNHLGVRRSDTWIRESIVQSGSPSRWSSVTWCDDVKDDNEVTSQEGLV